MRVFAPLPRAGFGQRRGGRSCRDGWDGRGSRPWWFGDGQAGCGCAAARSGARSSMYVLLSYCVLTCTRVCVGVVQCGLVIPASYEARGICCPYIYDVYKSLTLSSSRAESAVAAVAKSVQCTESRYIVLREQPLGARTPPGWTPCSSCEVAISSRQAPRRAPCREVVAEGSRTAAEEEFRTSAPSCQLMFAPPVRCTSGDETASKTHNTTDVRYRILPPPTQHRVVWSTQQQHSAPLACPCQTRCLP